MNKSSNIVRTDSVSLPYYNSVYYTYSDCKYPAPFLQVNNDGVALKAFIDNDIVKLKDGCSISSVFEPANAVGDCSYLKNYSIDSVFAYEKKVKYPGYMEMLSGDKNKIVYLPDWTWKASP